jgi:hypothetical protein
MDISCFDFMRISSVAEKDEVEIIESKRPNAERGPFFVFENPYFLREFLCASVNLPIHSEKPKPIYSSPQGNTSPTDSHLPFRLSLICFMASVVSLKAVKKGLLELEGRIRITIDSIAISSF